MPLDFSYESDSAHFFAPIGHNIIKLILSIIANLIFIFLNNVSIEYIFMIQMMNPKSIFVKEAILLFLEII